MARTELWRAMELLSVLSKMWDTEYVRDMWKEITKSYKKSYISKKDKELIKWLSKEEQEEFLSLSL